MAETTPEDRTALERLISDEFRARQDPPPPGVVGILASVGMGYLEASLGTLPPVSRTTEREQLAPFVVGTYLQGTRPSPNNNYLQELRQSGASYLRKVVPAPAPPVSDDALVCLATLAMGWTRETDPRATRAAATNHFIDLYLSGR
jgi:hypothetical protein